MSLADVLCSVPCVLALTIAAAAFQLTVRRCHASHHLHTSLPASHTKLCQGCATRSLSLRLERAHVHVRIGR